MPGGCPKVIGTMNLVGGIIGRAKQEGWVYAWVNKESSAQQRHTSFLLDLVRVVLFDPMLQEPCIVDRRVHQRRTARVSLDSWLADGCQEQLSIDRFQGCKEQAGAV